MRQAKYKKSDDRVVNLRLYKRLREGALIVAIAVSLFLLLALITYHTVDPAWTHTSFGNSVANFGGYFGAIISDVLFAAFGFVAYVFPFLLVYFTWIPFYESPELLPPGGLTFFVWRLVGFITILITASCLASLYFVTDFLPAGAGGILGDLVSQMLVSVFNIFGSGLIMFALLLAGSTLFSGLSWLQFIELIGKWTLIAGKMMLRGLKLFYPLLGSKDKTIEIYEDDVPVKKEPQFKREDFIKDKPDKIKINKSDNKNTFESSHDGSSKPSLSLLDMPEENVFGHSKEQLEKLSHEVELRLKDFGIEVRVVAVHPGPVITRFELDLAAGTKASKITALAKDLARSLSVISVRVVEVIPGKSVVGLELPNEHREVVRLREVLASKQYRSAHSPLSIALGKDISGHPVVVDLAKMPHLLVAGTTGSGKSVGLNALLLSLLYKYTPKELRLILIDPKMLELSIYEGIPHLLTPVVIDMKDAANALRWCVAEMERRYKLMASLGVRNILGYNSKVRDACNKGAPLLDPLWQADMEGEQEELQELPYIVVLADEFADMMMVVGKKVEELIARIAQKARAAGIHLVLATQRPSVDVITGLIKANIPTRIAFQVSSKIDSRTIIDQIGAEQLLGNGDMLYLPPGTVVPVRIHGAFVADEEVHNVVKYLKKCGGPEYFEEILDGSVAGIPGIDQIDSGDDAEKDQFYDLAVQFIMDTRKVSVSSVQRRFKIGYNRAARIVEAMEEAGLVSPMQSNGAREILVPNRS